MASGNRNLEEADRIDCCPKGHKTVARLPLCVHLLDFSSIDVDFYLGNDH